MPVQTAAYSIIELQEVQDVSPLRGDSVATDAAAALETARTESHLEPLPERTPAEIPVASDVARESTGVVPLAAMPLQSLGVPPLTGAAPGATPQVGDHVEYWSDTWGRWFPTTVLGVSEDGLTCDLAVKRGATIDRVRPMDRVPAPPFPVQRRPAPPHERPAPRVGGPPAASAPGLGEQASATDSAVLADSMLSAIRRDPAIGRPDAAGFQSALSTVARDTQGIVETKNQLHKVIAADHLLGAAADRRGAARALQAARQAAAGTPALSRKLDKLEERLAGILNQEEDIQKLLTEITRDDTSGNTDQLVYDVAFLQGLSRAYNLAKV